SVVDARYFSHFRFAVRCAELRGFAARISRTVEATVKSARPRAESSQPRESQDSRAAVGEKRRLCFPHESGTQFLWSLADQKRLLIRANASLSCYSVLLQLFAY